MLTKAVVGWERREKRNGHCQLVSTILVLYMPQQLLRQPITGQPQDLTASYLLDITHTCLHTQKENKSAQKTQLPYSLRASVAAVVYAAIMKVRQKYQRSSIVAALLCDSSSMTFLQHVINCSFMTDFAVQLQFVVSANDMTIQATQNRRRRPYHEVNMFNHVFVPKSFCLCYLSTQDPSIYEQWIKSIQFTVIEFFTIKGYIHTCAFSYQNCNLNLKLAGVVWIRSKVKVLI